MLEAAEGDPRIRVVRLSRNFGHQIALTAGVDLAAGDAVIVVDADLQDPPEVVLELAKRWREGYDIVYAVREEREGETRFKRSTAAWFYRGFNPISKVQVLVDVGDFRLVDRRALDVFNVRATPRGAEPRLHCLGGQLRVRHLEHHRQVTPLYDVPGWTSIVVVTTFIGGVQLMVLVVIGEYIGDIHDEVKRRPLYVIGELENFPEQPRLPPRAIVADRRSASRRAEP